MFLWGSVTPSFSGAGLAAASLLSNAQSSAGYSQRSRYRGRRDTDMTARNELAFQDLEMVDSKNDCGKLYLCQLATLSSREISSAEKGLILALRAPNGRIRYESASAPFEAALELGFLQRTMGKCRDRYSRCTINFQNQIKH